MHGYVGNQNRYAPPETWFEPSEEAVDDYRIIRRQPGEGYRHVLTPKMVRDRLAVFPESCLARLEVVQFSPMTRKKKQHPCYGMQWGNSIYLYPIEDDLVEFFTRPPKPSQLVEAKMFGGKWQDAGDGLWTLTWTEDAIVDFYLNNVLIHELGHLVDDRNNSYRDRERYAEWFAIEYGYKPTRN